MALQLCAAANRPPSPATTKHLRKQPAMASHEAKPPTPVLPAAGSLSLSPSPVASPVDSREPTPIAGATASGGAVQGGSSLRRSRSTPGRDSGVPLAGRTLAMPHAANISRNSSGNSSSGKVGEGVGQRDNSSSWRSDHRALAALQRPQPAGRHAALCLVAPPHTATTTPSPSPTPRVQRTEDKPAVVGSHSLAPSLTRCGALCGRRSSHPPTSAHPVSMPKHVCIGHGH